MKKKSSPRKHNVRKSIKKRKKLILNKKRFLKKKHTKSRNNSTIVEITSINSTSSSPKKRRRKKSNSSSIDKMYFTKDTENAIIEYNKETNKEKRDQIYNTRIKYAFDKLVENIFNTFKFSYFEVSPQEIQKETVSHLVANIDKFDPSRGSKAFSYFSIIAKHYLIAENNKNYLRFQRHEQIGENREENTVQLQSEDEHHKNLEMREFVKLMIKFWENNVNKIFNKKRDLDIANAVIELFRQVDRIDVFNKKALYLYIREISSCKTQQITKVINKMKQYQFNIEKSWVNKGMIHTDNYIKV